MPTVYMPERRRMGSYQRQWKKAELWDYVSGYTTTIINIVWVNSHIKLSQRTPGRRYKVKASYVTWNKHKTGSCTDRTLYIHTWHLEGLWEQWPGTDVFFLYPKFFLSSNKSSIMYCYYMHKLHKGHKNKALQHQIYMTCFLCFPALPCLCRGFQ